jgi:pimeloyl-ACP methyl ester carboxylesterase
MPPQLLTRAGTKLALWDLGGNGPPALLIHGLAGHAGEWDDTATWLRETRHVFALDLRGHGHSEQRPTSVSPAAIRDDVCFVLEQIGEPALLLGQSLGGRFAIPAAAARPKLVECLVIVEAGPEGSPDRADAKADGIAARLNAWPVPFADRSTAETFFGGRGLDAEAWTRGLREAPDGLHPRFEVDVLAQMLREAAAEDCWEAWSRVTRPTLIVRGGHGELPSEELDQMLAELPGAENVELAGAGHELHLEEPQLWRAAVTEFLDRVPRR